jgi:hypothetical protein
MSRRNALYRAYTEHPANSLKQGISEGIFVFSGRRRVRSEPVFLHAKGQYRKLRDHCQP